MKFFLMFPSKACLLEPDNKNVPPQCSTLISDV